MSSIQAGHISRALQLLRLEFRRSIGVITFVPLASITLWVTSRELPERLWLWNETAYALQNSVILLGPIAAGISALVAGRDRRRGMGELLTTMPAPPALQPLTTSLGMAAWAILPYFMATAVLTALTAWYATWGAPLAGPPIVGLVVLLMHAAAGFATGTWIPGRLIAPLVAIGAFGYQIIVSDWTSSTIRQFSAYRLGNQTDVFYELHPDLTLSYVVWALGVTGIATMAAMLRSARGRLLSGLLIIFIVVTLAGGIRLVTTADSPQERVAIAYEHVCMENVVQVCVHPAFEPILPETADAIRSLTKPVSQLEDVPNRAEQRSMYDNPYGDPASNSNVIEFELVNPAFHEGGFRILARDISWYLVGSPDNPLEARAQAVVADWLMVQAGFEIHEQTESGSYRGWGWTTPFPGSEEAEALDQLGKLSEGERRNWLKSHWTALRAGELTLEDLP